MDYETDMNSLPIKSKGGSAGWQSADLAKTRDSLKQADFSDLDWIIQTLKDGRDTQRAMGFVQWDDRFPDPNVITEDLKKAGGWIFKADGRAAGYVFLDTHEAAYDQKSALWKWKEPYLVLHRVAFSRDFVHQGLGRRLLAAVEKKALAQGISVLRIDTLNQNKAMLGLLARCGWLPAGEVTYPFGHRLVFEKKIGQ